jgi:Uma2 family endonuclease
MTQAKPRFATFEQYLSFSDGLDGRYEWIAGELVELPPEADPELELTTEQLLRV